MARLGVEACLSLEEKELFFSTVGTGQGLDTGTGAGA